MLVIIPCGSAKKTTPSPAGEMYTGGFHRACQAYALQLVGGDRERVLILSAKYGFLRLSDPIEPYELRMGQRGCIGVARLRKQVQHMGIEGEQVIALGGSDYTSLCRILWLGNCQTPMAGLGGIGKQLKWLKEKLDA